LQRLSLIFAVFVVRARDFERPFYYFLEWSITSPIVIWGFLQRPRPAEEFPDLLSKLKASSEPAMDA
jgi:hypothetical protein